MTNPRHRTRRAGVLSRTATCVKPWRIEVHPDEPQKKVDLVLARTDDGRELLLVRGETAVDLVILEPFGAGGGHHLVRVEDVVRCHAERLLQIAADNPVVEVVPHLDRADVRDVQSVDREDDRLRPMQGDALDVRSSPALIVVEEQRAQGVADKDHLGGQTTELVIDDHLPLRISVAPFIALEFVELLIPLEQRHGVELTKGRTHETLDSYRGLPRLGL
jgi:hypothetical protein